VNPSNRPLIIVEDDEIVFPQWSPQPINRACLFIVRRVRVIAAIYNGLGAYATSSGMTIKSAPTWCPSGYVVSS
jgi:hypothetical protein